MNVIRKEYFIVKQELMDREEEIEMLKDENRHLKSQLLSAGIVKKEAAALRIKDEPTMFDPSEYTFLSTTATIESDPLFIGQYLSIQVKQESTDVKTEPESIGK